MPGTASAVRFSNCCHVLINRERGGGVQLRLTVCKNDRHVTIKWKLGEMEGGGGGREVKNGRGGG